MRLSIVVPAHNEQENIAEVIHKIEGSLKMEHELVVVNDHSTDSTPDIVLGLARQYPNLRLVSNPLEGGFANALRTGFSNIRTDLVIPVMADLCDDLATIEAMFKKINEGYDVVCGCRYTDNGARLGGSRLKGFLSCLGGRSIHYLLDIPTYDVANAFKMYRKKVIDSIDIQARSFEISMEMALKAYYAGFKITEVPTVWRERTKGKSNFKVFKLLPGYLKLYIWAVWKKLTI
jgi:glycosyltransferase involved in cell wall biosynthesis